MSPGLSSCQGCQALSGTVPKWEPTNWGCNRTFHAWVHVHVQSNEALDKFHMIGWLLREHPCHVEQAADAYSVLVLDLN